MNTKPATYECAPRQSPGRYAPARIAAAARAIDRSLLDTPLLRPAALSEALGCTLTLKDEGRNRLGCFKGRGADWYVQSLPAGGDATLVCASAGNFGLALADAGARRGLRVQVYVSRHANPHKVERIRAAGARIVVAGDDFDAAKSAARAAAARDGLAFVEDGERIEISEGAGSIGVELSASGGHDVALIPVGNGALAAGIGAWLRHAAPATRIVGVCSAGAPVMRELWLARRIADPARAPHRAHARAALEQAIAARATAHTIADGIAVRMPVPAAVDDLDHALDDFVAVSDTALTEAQALLHATTGLTAEPSAVAGLAALARHRAAYAGLRVATVLTGDNQGT